MPSIKKCLILDYQTVKPYMTFKNLTIYVGAALLMGVVTQNPYIMSAMLTFAVTIMYSRFLFAVGEQNGIDVLYCSLPIPRKAIVKGRYLFLTLLIFLTTIFAWFLAGGVGVAFFPGFALKDTLVLLIVCGAYFVLFLL